MCASVIWTPTFGVTKFGGYNAKVLNPHKWVEPTPETIADFWPKKDEDIDNYEKHLRMLPCRVLRQEFL